MTTVLRGLRKNISSLCRKYDKMALNLKRVLISDEIDEKCIDVLKSNGIDVVKNTKLSKEQLIEEIKNYDGLIVRSATKVTAEVINAGSRLSIIGRAGTGVDNIDTDAATKRGVIVMNTPGGNTMSAAELTCSLIMVTARHIAAGCASLKAGRWDRKKYMGNEVYGKTLAIVGLGRIGKEVATRMQSFGMTTIGYDPITPADVAASWGVEWMELEKVWPLADYITVHTPLIPQTKNLINDEVFSKCKKGVRIINCARGGIIDEDALLRALESGQCAAAGLDVFVDEPPTNRALVDHPLVTGTPHLGASTVEAQSRVAVEIAEQFVDVKNAKSLFGAINAQAMSQALGAETKPYVQLASSLGAVASAAMATVDKQVQIQLQTEGPSLSKASSYLNAAALVGLLRTSQQNGLNLVSAPAYAKELGVQVSNVHSDSLSSSYPELVTLCLTSSAGNNSVSGTVAAGQPLLTAINGNKLNHPFLMQGQALIYKAQGQVIANLQGALKDNMIQAFVSTSVAEDNSRWEAVQLASPVQNVDAIKPLTSQLINVTF